jgi:peptidylprolyl isomerase
MKKMTRLLTLTSLGAVLGFAALQAAATKSTTMTDSTIESTTATQSSDQNIENKDVEIDMKKLSEAIGNSIGKNLKTNAFSFDVDQLIKGIREGAEGKPSPLSEQEVAQMMSSLQQKAFKEMSETNLKAANEYLEKNSKEQNVKEIVPGKLQYTVIQEGTGETIEPHSSPLINYTGKYKDGTVFGTSEETGGPIAIPLDQTIPGFSKGIVGMKEGEKRKLFIHPDLGYGTSGQLPPNELLIFEIEAVKAKSDSKDKDGDHTGSEGIDLGDDQDDDLFIDEEEEYIEPKSTERSSSASQSKY